MADSSPAPGYYSGPPAAATHKAPPSEPVDVQVNAEVPGYYEGPAHGKKTAAAGGKGKGSAPPNKESGFFASCCACFSGGETAR